MPLSTTLPVGAEVRFTSLFSRRPGRGRVAAVCTTPLSVRLDGQPVTRYADATHPLYLVAAADGGTAVVADVQLEAA